MPKSIRDVIIDINKMKIASGDISAYDFEAMEDYIDKEMKGQQVDTNSAVGTHLRELMTTNPQIRKELASVLQQTDRARKNHMTELRTVAGRSGMDKIKNDFWGKRKREAKRELERIAQAKRKTLNKTELNKDASHSISKGRGRKYFTWLTNKFGLGTHDERHPKDVEFDDTHLSNTFTYRTPDGELSGAYFKPDNPNPSGKVVLFFSGSGAPAEQFSANVVDDYAKEGIPVVTMNYRGFGESKTLDKNGNPKGTPLSEKSIYKDGKEMLNYVINVMHVKPENIILHGYSLGGAVASKVAADFAQTQQKKALEEGRNPKKLGGIVLHSPINSMYSAGHNQIYDAFRGIPYVGGVLAVTLGHALGDFSGREAYLHSGAYNTKSHMERLHKFDPDIPVHYTSGLSRNGDGLGLDRTKLHLNPKADFVNSSSSLVRGDHDENRLNTKNGGLQRMLNTSRNDVVKKPQEPQVNAPGL